MLSSSFRCDQIYKYELLWFWSHFVVLLKSDLDVQQTHLLMLHPCGFEPHSKTLDLAKKLSRYKRPSLLVWNVIDKEK